MIIANDAHMLIITLLIGGNRFQFSDDTVAILFLRLNASLRQGPDRK